MHNSDPRLVLRIFVQSAERNLVLVHSHLLEAIIVTDLWIFDVDLELARLSHLEEACHEDHSCEELTRPDVVLLGVAWVQPAAENVQNISEDVGFHLSEIVWPFFWEIVLALGDDESRCWSRWSFLGAHDMATVFWEVKVKLWPKGIEPSLIPDNFHLECCLFSNVEVQLPGEDFFIGKIEVFWACYNVLRILYLLSSDLDGLVIWWCEVVNDSCLRNLNLFVLLFPDCLFLILIIEKELAWLWWQCDGLYFFLPLFLNLDLLCWLLLRSPSSLRSLLYIRISDLQGQLAGAIEAFNRIFDHFLDTVLLDIILKDLYLVTLLYWCKSTSINKYFICCFLSRLALGSSFIFLSLYFLWDWGLILLGEDGAT